MNKRIVFVLVIYLITCLIYGLNRTPFYDEAHAYTISQLSFFEIFQVTKSEGHCALWYILLKIFCPNLNHYPYNMQIFNWIIYCFLTIFFWLKSPFNTAIKTIILLTYPFLHFYATVSRPYGLCVLVLFALTYLYKEKIKQHPYFFAALLFICSQLGIMTLIGASVFYLLFLYDSIKINKTDKKTILLVSSIFIFGTLLFLAQVFNTNIEQMRDVEQIVGFYEDFTKFIYAPFLINQNTNYCQLFFNLVCCILFYSVAIVFFKKNKTSFLFILLTSFLMSFFFFNFYIGSFWHYFFYIIYLIIAYWIGYDDLKNYNFLNRLLILFLILLTIPYSLFTYGFSWETSHAYYYKTLINEVLKIDTKNSKIFCLDYYSPFSAGTLPYLTQKNIVIHDMLGNPLNSVESLKMTFKFRNKPLDFKTFVSKLDKNKKNYLVNQATNLELRCLDATKVKIVKGEGFTYSENDTTLFFKIVSFIDERSFAIYEIKVMNDKK